MLFIAETRAKITETFLPQIEVANSVVTLRCAAFGSPLPKIKWLKNLQPLTPEKVSDPKNFEHQSAAISAYTIQSSIIFLSVQLADSAFYTCQAENSGGEDEFTEKVYVHGELSKTITYNVPSIH